MEGIIDGIVLETSKFAENRELLDHVSITPGFEFMRNYLKNIPLENGGIDRTFVARKAKTMLAGFDDTIARLVPNIDAEDQFVYRQRCTVARWYTAVSLCQVLMNRFGAWVNSQMKTENTGLDLYRMISDTSAIAPLEQRALLMKKNAFQADYPYDGGFELRRIHDNGRELLWDLQYVVNTLQKFEVGELLQFANALLNYTRAVEASTADYLGERERITRRAVEMMEASAEASQHTAKIRPIWLRGVYGRAE